VPLLPLASGKLPLIVASWMPGMARTSFELTGHGTASNSVPTHFGQGGVTCSGIGRVKTLT